MSTHPLPAYSLLACLLSWAWWLPLALGRVTTRPGQGWPTHLPGLLGAALAAVAVTALTQGKHGLRELAARAWRWRVPARWYLLIAATAAMVMLAPAARAFTGAPLPAARDYLTYSGLGRLPPVLTVLLVVGINGFGEEIGWRGFLAHRLLERHGLIPTALIVAPVWALWHLPLFWFVAPLASLGVAGIAGWLIGLTAGSIVLTWLYVASGRSIAIVALWHAAFNFATATAAAQGLPAAAASTLVMLLALVIAIRRPRSNPTTPPRG